MKIKTLLLLNILICVAMIGAAVTWMIPIPGVRFLLCLIMIMLSIFNLVFGKKEIRLHDNDRIQECAPHFFGPEPVDPVLTEQKKWKFLGLLIIICCPYVVSILFFSHMYAGLAALVLMFIGLILIRWRMTRLEKEAAERLRQYGDTKPIEFASYHFDDEGLSRAAEILSASRVSELPAGMPYYNKMDRLVEDGSCVVFSRGIGIDAILRGVQAVIARRELEKPVITKEIVFAQDTEQIRNRRRDGKDTVSSDLNEIGRLLEDVGYVLLDIFCSPIGGYVITVVSTAEMGRLRVLGYQDLEDVKKVLERNRQKIVRSISGW